MADGKLNINIFRDKLVERPVDYELIDDRKRKILGEVSEKLGKQEAVPLTPAFLAELQELGLEKKVREMLCTAEQKYRLACLLSRGDENFDDPYKSTGPYSDL